MTAAYYDFFRKITLQPDGVTLEADSVSDTLTITGGNGVAFNPNVSADSFEIDVNYQLFVPIGSTKIRLNDINSNYTDITMTAGSNMSVGRNSANELVFTSTVGGTSKAVSGATQASPVVITTNTQHQFTEGIAVTITDIVGMTELNGNEYYMDILTSQTFALYTDSNLTTPLNGTGFTAYGSGGVAVAEYSAPQALSQLNDVDLVGTPPVNGTYLQYNGTSWQAGTTLAGDLTGSVFGDDSTILVDGVAGKIVGDIENASIVTDSLTINNDDFLITNPTAPSYQAADFTISKYSNSGYELRVTGTASNRNLQLRVNNGYQVSIYENSAYVSVPVTFSSNISFEGDNNDGFETTLSPVEPLQDATITVPNTTGTMALTSQLNGVENQLYVGNVDGIVTGVLSGSVFGDDSSLLVDGINNRLVMANNTTDDLAEGSNNKYFTNGRAIAMTIVFG